MLNERLLEACQAGAPSAELQSLVREGAFAFVQDEAGWTALHYAAARNDAELVEWLLANGAVWNIVDHSHFASLRVPLEDLGSRRFRRPPTLLFLRITPGYTTCW
jgi:ankyrin repeat protein